MIYLFNHLLICKLFSPHTISNGWSDQPQNLLFTITKFTVYYHERPRKAANFHIWETGTVTRLAFSTYLVIVFLSIGWSIYRLILVDLFNLQYLCYDFGTPINLWREKTLFLLLLVLVSFYLNVIYRYNNIIFLLIALWCNNVH